MKPLVLPIIRSIFKQVDQRSENLKNGAETANRLREFVFNSIEGVVILAALELALDRSDKPWIWVVYVVAWTALALYLLTSAKYVVSRFTENLEWSITHRDLYLWLVGALSLGISIAITYVLPALTAEFIRVNFTGSP